MTVYVSVPYKKEYLSKKVLELLDRHSIKSLKYDKNEEYTTKKLSEADACIFVLGEFFEYDITKLTNGVFTELLYCINNRKPIYLYYESQLGPRIYAAEITEDLHLKGIQGTSDNIFRGYEWMNNSYQFNDNPPKVFEWESSNETTECFY